ncbi:MAG: two pore domain potassium channel family protein [Acholeplasmatales bacterium]|nr:two pore domain potassium channel family protein [Acholeplasmatales bacterium]
MKKKETIFLVINFALAILTMVLVLIVTERMMKNDNTLVSLFLGLAILSEAVYQVLSFITNHRKIDKIRSILVGCMFVAAGVLAFMSKNYAKLFYYSAFLVVLAMAVNQFLNIGKEDTKIGTFTNILIGLVLIGLGVSIIINIYEENAKYISLVTVNLLLFSSLKKMVFPSFRIEKVKLLLDIMVKTHVFDVLLCLGAFIIAFSYILPMVEPTINNFYDAAWYCFAVITTIGFGDFAATSAIGRVLTVILGIYGIVVVAIITSVIVNFYNEVSAKEKNRNIIE